MDWIAQVLWLSSTRALAEHSQLLPYLELENVMRLFWLWFLALACSTWLFSRRESVQHPSGFAPKGEYEEVIKAKGQTPSKWAAKTRVFWHEAIGCHPSAELSHSLCSSRPMPVMCVFSVWLHCP